MSLPIAVPLFTNILTVYSIDKQKCPKYCPNYIHCIWKQFSKLTNSATNIGLLLLKLSVKVNLADVEFLQIRHARTTVVHLFISYYGMPIVSLDPSGYGGQRED